MDESGPAIPDRETGCILRETESVVLGAPGGGTVARLAGIYGPGRSVLLRKFLAGEAVIEGDGARWLNQIHRDDAVAALFRLAQPDAPPGVYNVSDDTPLSSTRALPRSGRSPRPPPAAHRPPSISNANVAGRAKRVCNDRMRALGWRPVYPSFLDWARGEAL